MNCSEFYEISYSLNKGEMTLSKVGKNFFIQKDNKKIYEFFIDLDDGIKFKIYFLRSNGIYEEFFNYKIMSKVSGIRVEVDENCFITKIHIKTNIINYMISINENNYVTEISKYKVLKNLVKIYNFSEIDLDNF